MTPEQAAAVALRKADRVGRHRKFQHDKLVGTITLKHLDTILAALDAAQAPRDVPRLTDEQISDAVHDADLDWHHGWTLDETQPNRFTQFARAVESRVRELCGVAP